MAIIDLDFELLGIAQNLRFGRIHSIHASLMLSRTLPSSETAYPTPIFLFQMVSSHHLPTHIAHPPTLAATRSQVVTVVSATGLKNKKLMGAQDVSFSGAWSRMEGNHSHQTRERTC